MRLGWIVSLAAISAFLASPSLAQEVERYQLQRTDDGYVRLDTVTGRMTICREQTGELVCKVASEERAASSGSGIEELQARIESLEGRIAALEAAPPEAGLPTDEEFERTMGYMERFFRGFIGMAKDLDRELGADEPVRPDPNRT